MEKGNIKSATSVQIGIDTMLGILLNACKTNSKEIYPKSNQSQKIILPRNFLGLQCYHLLRTLRSSVSPGDDSVSSRLLNHTIEVHKCSYELL